MFFLSSVGEGGVSDPLIARWNITWQ